MRSSGTQTAFYSYKDRDFGESKIATVKIRKQKNPAAMLPGSF